MFKNKIYALLSILLTVTMLNASAVNIRLLSGEVYSGETVSFEIVANGKDIEFPDIEYIDNNKVSNNGSSSSTSIINGVRKEEISKRFSFIITKNTLIPEYSIKINGKEYKTNQIFIKVSIPKISKNNDKYILKMKLLKKELYIGETTELKVTAKIKENSGIDKINLIPPIFKDIELIELNNKSKAYSEHGYTVNEIYYKVIPEHIGTIELNSLKMQIGIMNNNTQQSIFSMLNGRQLKWKKVFSNSLELNVKEIPDNVNIIGENLIIQSTIDTKKVELGKPVNLIIKITGLGNLEDIKKYNIKIDNATIYYDEPIIKDNVFLQKIAIIGNSDFTIPKIELKYFDKIQKKTKIIETNNILIKVKTPNISSKVKKEKKTKKIINVNKKEIKSNNIETNYILLIITSMISFIFGYFIANIGKINIRKYKEEENILELIKKTKKDKELYELLLPYNNNIVVAEILEKLEKNIYKKGKEKIIKQELYNYFGNLN